MFHVLGFTNMEGSNQPHKEEESVIRTMASDIKRLSKKGAPPEGLPVFSMPEKEQEKIKEEEGKKAVQQIRQEPEAKKEGIEKNKQGAKEKIYKKVEDKRAQNRKNPMKLVMIISIIVLIAGGLGGFVYWWNYLRAIPPLPVITHYECQDSQCISINGEGTDQCQIHQDCEPVEPIEPVIPEALMPIHSTNTIEFTEQDNLIEKIIAIELEKNDIVNRLIVKKDNQILNLLDLISILNLVIPENISSSFAEAEIIGDNYTLFLYKQTQGNRLGLVIKIAQSETLATNLKDWEITMTNNLESLLLIEEIPPAFTEGFQDNIYRDIAIRYLNFPDPGLSIDYGIPDNKLILTTSQESMYAIINLLMPAAEN